VSAPRLERAALGSFAATAAREWLVTNGLGGYASGTVGGANTRRYHGLLVASLRPPLGRTVMVAALNVFVQAESQRVALSAHEFADGTVAPQGYRNLLSFHLEGQIPVWTWLIGEALLEQRVWMAHGCNTTYVSWHLQRSLQPLQMEVEPLCTWRDYHWQHRGRSDPQLSIEPSGAVITAFEGAAPYFLRAENGSCEAAPEWYWNFMHRDEASRGLDAVEDLFRPVRLRFTLAPGASNTLVLSSDLAIPASAAASLRDERARQASLLRDARRATPALARIDAEHLEPLIFAADQFVVARSAGSKSSTGHSVIAGYPWFGDWGRDTMIALPGLALTTGRIDVAADILRTFARHVSEGMLPNRFPDDGEAPEYNTVDATLWFFVAIHEYLRRSADAVLRRDLYPILKDIVDWHLRGTRYGIGVDREDCLLRAGEAGVQLTWMDAKVGDWVVTPRIGKPVEINALWINALLIQSEIATAEGDSPAARRCTELAQQATQSFRQRYWNAEQRYLYDVIDGPEGELTADGRRADASLRPNQLFAVSLPHALVNARVARAVVDTLWRELWTPMGLRSLAPRDRQYVGSYLGGPRERDAVYHQGTVWGWLLGPFALAHFRVYRDVQAANALLDGFRPHLTEACVGQMSEIFDGDAPFASRGCFAQAWSVAETLRAWSDINANSNPTV
jgi:predicted glycogen debranching enzyme